MIRRIRNSMAGAGLRVEDSKGECNLGQHEINFAYGPALQTADEHSIYKNGAKEIAAQEGMAITFMAKLDEREGSSCHIHLSLRRDDGTPLFADDQQAFDRFVAGQLACMREMTLFFAPNINSYKRYAEGTFAPTAVAWGEDNRTCSLRAVGHGPGRRIEYRVPGADVNPYLALSAHDRRGAARHGRRARARAGASRATPTPPTSRASRARCATPRRCSGRARWRARPSATRSSRHYLNYARVELAAFDSAVTDWERRRGFERL